MHNVEFLDLYCMLDSRVSKSSHKIGKECSMHGSEGNLEQIYDWRIGRKESIQKAL